MKRRMLVSLAAAAIVGSVFVTQVSAQGGAQAQKFRESGQPQVTAEPCLPPTVVASAAVHDFSKRSNVLRRKPIPAGAHKGAAAFARTELFFGTAKPIGEVTDEDFRVFLDTQITPRFPDGLTVLKGDGQFRVSTGEIIKEASFVLILLYPIETFKDSSKRIENIRECYKLTFEQESVLRADDPFASWVSF